MILSRDHVNSPDSYVALPRPHVIWRRAVVIWPLSALAPRTFDDLAAPRGIWRVT
ncbi:MAG TPA: hypothetical protein VH080_01075 [Gemmatimonadaceae bacterium]|nr:hypothetical protein [Gemmatimonadaceae bacterium]